MALPVNDNPWEKSAPKKANTLVQPTTVKGGSSLDINFRKVIRVWPIAILTALLGTFAAWLTLRYAIPIYQASMQVSLKEDLAAQAAVPTGTFTIRDPFNDKIDMMQSPAVAWRVVEKLGLQYTAVSKGQLKNKDLYGILRWQVLNESSQTRPFSFTIIPIDRARFNWQRGSSTGQAYWGVPFSLIGDSVLVETKTRFANDAEIICTRYDMWSLARYTAARLAVSPQQRSNTILVSLVDEVPERAVDMLNQLASAYDQTTIDAKNKSLEQSLVFIQERLNPLERELDSIENAIVDFRAANKIFSRTETTAEYLSRTSELDGELGEIGFKFELLNLLQQYVNDPRTKDENLSLVGLEDSYLQGLVSRFQELRIRKEQIERATTTENPRRQAIDEEFNTAKKNIDIQIDNYRKVLNLMQRDAAQKLNAINNQLVSAPIQERELLTMERQRKIKQDLYMVLLERREEAAITLASTTSETSVLSPPAVSGPISPQAFQYYAIATGLGLLIPFAFAFLRQLLDHSISSKKQLQALTGAPIIGVVDFAEGKDETVFILGEGDRSAVAEQIRSIRANLSFYADDVKPQYIMITSSFSGEGKTFISANLAQTFALQGLKVALIEFDMRKPKLAKNLGLKPTIGLSSALLGKGSFADIAIPDKTWENLHLYPTGVVPPNPSELMASKRMDSFKQYLDENYDVVVMDTPPMGLVSDAQLLTPWSHVTLLVVRYGFTPKGQLVEVDEWYKTGVLGKMGIIFNGVKTRGYSGYRYSPYYYKHRYGNDYYTNDSSTKRNRWWSFPGRSKSGN